MNEKDFFRRVKEHPTAPVIGTLETLPLGHKRLQRGPERHMIVLAVIEVLCWHDSDDIASLHG